MPRATQLIDSMLATDELAKSSDSDIANVHARLLLTQAEVHWLSGRIPDATEVSDAALAMFEQAADWIGLADVHYLKALLQADLGQIESRTAMVIAAADFASRGNDGVRVAFLERVRARWDAISDIVKCESTWGTRLDTCPYDSPMILAATLDYLGARAYNGGDLAGAVRLFGRSHVLAMETGQLFNALVVARNLGNALVMLNDLDDAFDWMQRALAIARPTGSPVILGPLLGNTGETMMRMGKLDAAKSLLDEALAVSAPISNSRAYALIFGAMGDLALAQQNYNEAYRHFEEYSRRAKKLAQVDMEIVGLIGRATALLLANHFERAHREAKSALALAERQGAMVQVVSAWKLIGQIAQKNGLVEDALSCFQKALSIAKKIDGYLIPDNLYSELASLHAANGDFAVAYDLSIEATRAKALIYSKEATDSATAMQVRMENARVLAETEHHRAMAQSEALRAQTLERSTRMLEHLGTIGQEITAQLNQEKAFEVIYRHVHGLLDTSSIAIYMMDADGLGLTSVYDIEEGEHLTPDHVPLTDADSNAVRCVRERRELLVEFEPGKVHVSHVPGTLVSLSALFAPLMVGNRILGVLTIQSLKAHAYGQQELLIFKSLCSYAAIALDNATAYTHLKEVQAQLVANEKMAALGSLVAGVAHELNTPIGNSLLIATTLQDKTKRFFEEFQSNTLRKTSLAAYVDDAQHAASLIVNGLEIAADLVRSFKQVAVDQSSENRRVFNLRQTIEDTVATLMRNIDLAGHAVQVDVPHDIPVDGYPGPLGQVVTNLINNSLLHGFEDRVRGQISITGRVVKKGRIELVYCDDGNGISEDNLKRIFDPFFTTKLGRGGSGLGLSISRNIVTSLLGGTLEATSAPGKGVTFTIGFPAIAPSQ
ncbi:MAG: GAF domain-containing protein [Rhodoferax sp.]|nr:GAF domain-containing protein [Rhodoferax sp.]